MYLDPVSDLLLRIRNATKNKSATVTVNTSKLALNILQILQQEGYIVKFVTTDLPNNKKSTVVHLKYKQNKSAIFGLKQISKPGLRIYAQAHKLPWVLNGLGIAIISTNLGLMTNKQARKQKVGGEVIAYVW